MFKQISVKSKIDEHGQEDTFAAEQDVAIDLNALREFIAQEKKSVSSIRSAVSSARIFGSGS